MIEPSDTGPAYPNARIVAQRVRAHLTQNGGPDATAIEAMVDAAFWASLRREEGRTPLLSLAFVSPEQVKYALRFARHIPLAAQSLTRVAPAVERPGIHLGVFEESGQLRVWGATRDLPPHSFVLEVVAAGLLVIKQSPGEESGKFVNIAVLQGDELKVVDQRSARLPDCPDLLITLLGLESHHAPADSVNVLIQLAVSMRAHGRGGTLLVVPAGVSRWESSMVQPIVYAVTPAYTALAALMQSNAEDRGERWWQDALRRAVDAIAGLTAVDGATIVTDRYALLAFGAKIVRRPAQQTVTRVMVTEPIEDSPAEVVEPSALGGTRHLSAAQFAQDQQDSIALVASQDGRFTVFAWSPCEEMVHAHRIESLLL